MRQTAPGVSSPWSVDRYLLPHERQLITIRRHPAILLGPSVTVLAALAVVVTLTGGWKFSGYVLLIIWLAWGLLLLRLIWRVANWRVDYFVVTAERMLVIRGLLAQDVTMVPMARMTDMAYQRPTLGRILGYGTFIAELSGRDQEMRKIDFLPYPEQLYLEVAGIIFGEPGRQDSHGPDEGP
jgi:membrane protein YdbS with pleckstrin-like domain